MASCRRDGADEQVVPPKLHEKSTEYLSFYSDHNNACDTTMSPTPCGNFVLTLGTNDSSDPEQFRALTQFTDPNGKSSSANELEKYFKKREKSIEACRRFRLRRKQELDRLRQENPRLVQRVAELEMELARANQRIMVVFVRC